MRKLIFWLHLGCGVVAGLVVLLMSVTGVILTYERQLLARQDRVYYAAAPANAEALPLEELARRATTGTFTPTAIILTNDPAAPAILSAGRSGRRHLNPYTGEVYAAHSDRLDQFFSTVTGWHRWFNVSGEGRNTARSITAACNLMFLFLVLSGIYLWLPAVFRWATFRMRLWFHPNARRGQARDFNWHHVFGFWAFLPLAVIVATATVFHYSWANDLVYRLAGDVPPSRAQAPGATDIENATDSDDLITALPLDSLVASAIDSGLPGDWKTLTVNLPAQTDANLTIAIDQGNGGQPQKRHTLTLDRGTGAVANWAPFSSQSPGRQARSWVRFLHTGEALGIIGQTVAGLVSFFAVLMVWTGLSMSLRRFLAFLDRNRLNATGPGSLAVNRIPTDPHRRS